MYVDVMVCVCQTEIKKLLHFLLFTNNRKVCCLKRNGHTGMATATVTLKNIRIECKKVSTLHSYNVCSQRIGSKNLQRDGILNHL